MAILVGPLAGKAQPAGKMPRIGMLGLARPSPATSWWAQVAFVERLAELGYVEGKNIAFEWRSTRSVEALPRLASELVDLKVDVIVVGVCGAPLNAAWQATRTIPIVVGSCNDDLVATGAVASLARPGGNVTGFSKLTPELAAKRLELLKEAFPRVSRVAVLWNPAYSDFRSDWTEIRRAAERLGVVLHPVEFRNASEFEPAFAVISAGHYDALIMFSDVVGYGWRDHLAALAII